MADVNVDVDVDVDDFLDACSSREIEEVVQWLKDNDELQEGELDQHKYSIHELSIVESLNKIKNNLIQLSSEEEDLIKEIANRF